MAGNGATTEARQLVADLRGPKAAEIAQALFNKGLDSVREALFALAGLAVAAKDPASATPPAITVNPEQERIVQEIKALGADIIPASVYQKLGLEFNPVNSLSQADIDWVKSLPEDLQKLVALVPVKGNQSAHKFGELANEKATEAGMDEVARLGSDSQKLGSTRAGDRWVFIIKEALLPSINLTRDNQAKLIPAGFEWINPAEAYLAVALKRFATENADAYFKGPWVRTSSPRSVVSDHYSSGAAAIDYAPGGQDARLGAGVSRISK